MSKLRVWYIVPLALLALFFLVLVASSPGAADHNIQNFTTNEDRAHAIQLDPPASLDAVEIWRRPTDENEDWWRFNANTGQHVQVKFRKYEQWENYDPPFEGGTYRMNYEVQDSHGTTVYHYDRDFGNGDRYLRDMWSYVVPESPSGVFYIRVWVTTTGNDWRLHAYYWLNLTVEDFRDLNAASNYAGVMSIHDGYTADYDPIDYFTVDLEAGPTTSDLVTLDFHKDHASLDLVLEVWEHLPFGDAENAHMLNRTVDRTATDLQVEFLATYTGTYTIVLYRDFWDNGSTPYTLSIDIGSRAHDGDNLPDGGTLIDHSITVRDVPIEMGYDTHDWYAVPVIEGDTIFKLRVDINDDRVDDGHGFEMVVYNETGVMLWAGSSVPTGSNYNDYIDLPPIGTVIDFPQNETIYVRFSADAGVSARSVDGFRTTYDIEFELQNRPFVVLSPLDEVYEWDEDGNISIHLDPHFADPDGDTIKYYLQNKTAGFTHDQPGLLFDGWLNITSPPNWNGVVVWVLKVQEEGQNDPTRWKFFDLVLIVHSVPDLPMSNGTLQLSCDEEGSVTTDLHRIFYDVDEGPGGVLTFGYTDTGITEVEVILHSGSGSLELVPDADVFGTFTFDVFCKDDNDLPVPGKVELTVNAVNDIPRITAPIDDVEMEEGGDPVEVDLSLYFHDVDGDVLVYTFFVPSRDDDHIDVFHKDHLLSEHRIVIELSDEGFFGTVTINITCTDPKGTLVRQDLTIVVSNVADRPRVDYFPSDDPGAIEETGSITFEVTDVLDDDLSEIGHHTITWYLDGEEVKTEVGTSSQYTFTSDYDSAGTYVVRAVVTDPTGLEAVENPRWTFTVNDKNRLPSVSLTAPPTTAEEGETVVFTATGSDPDGDELEFLWYHFNNNNELLGSGTTLEMKMPGGTQKIVVEVSDGNGGTAKVSHTIEVTVTEEETTIGMYLVVIVVVVLVVLVAVALLMMRRKGAVEALPDEDVDLEGIKRGYDPTGNKDGSYGGDYESTEVEWGDYEEYKPY